MLRALGWRGVAMGSLVPWLAAPLDPNVPADPTPRTAAPSSPPPKLVGITFDDGYRNNLTHALPVLRAVGFTATCYVLSARAGGTNDWDASRGVATAPLMTVDDWRRWHDAGMEIGAHGRTHRDLTTLDDHAARDEIAGARAELRAALGADVAHYCYPYGRYGPRDVALVRDAGYRTAATVRRGRATLASDPLQLPRVMIAHRTHALNFWIKLATAYEDRRALRRA